MQPNHNSLVIVARRIIMVIHANTFIIKFYNITSRLILTKLQKMNKYIELPNSPPGGALLLNHL